MSRLHVVRSVVGFNIGSAPHAISVLQLATGYPAPDDQVEIGGVTELCRGPTCHLQRDVFANLRSIGFERT